MSGIIPKSADPSTRSGAFEYRPELDGLRTLAVYLVVAFHSGVQIATGGFVGVDVFFVLSGFLITNVIFNEHARTGDFQLARFYARRIRRLLPASMAAIVGTSVVMSIFYSQVARTSWIEDAQAALLYVSNWRFIADSRDYFAEGIGQSPFIHFWSLSIEEQFYAVFPILLIGALTVSARVRWLKPQRVLASLVLLSVVLQVWIVTDDPSRAYYGTDTRIYQIAAGAALALGFRSLTKTAWVPFRSAFAAIGVMGLVWVASSGADFGPSTRGLIATLLSLTAVAGLESNRAGIANRILASKTVVYLGKISYGTYLWHWPVILALFAVFDMSSIVVFGIATAASTSLASLSYEILEKPVRTAEFLNKTPKTVVGGGILLSLVVAFVVIPSLLNIDRKPIQISNSGNQVDSFVLPASNEDFDTPVPTNFDRGNRHGVEGVPPREDMHCEHGDPSECIIHNGNGPHIMLIGDSHAARLVPAMLQLARDHDFTLSLSALASCRWQQGLAPEDFRKEECYTMRDDLYARIVPKLSPDLIIGVNVGYAPVGVRDSDLIGLSSEEVIASTTERSIDALLRHTRALLIMEPLPIAGFHVKDCFSAARFVSECVFMFGEGKDHHSSMSSVYAALYRKAADSRTAVWAASYSNLTCPTGSPCVPFADGFATMDDVHHVSAPRAVDRREFFWAEIEKILANIANS